MSTQNPSGTISNTYTCTRFSKHHNTEEAAILSLSKRSKILSFIHTHRPIDERQRGAKERGRRSGRGEKDWKGDGDKGLSSAVRHTAGVRHRGPRSSALSLETAQMCQAPASERFPSLWPVDPSPAGGLPTNSHKTVRLLPLHYSAGITPKKMARGGANLHVWKRKEPVLAHRRRETAKWRTTVKHSCRYFYPLRIFTLANPLILPECASPLWEKFLLCVCVCARPCYAVICLYWNSSVSWPTFLSWGADTQGWSDG